MFKKRGITIELANGIIFIPKKWLKQGFICEEVYKHHNDLIRYELSFWNGYYNHILITSTLEDMTRICNEIKKYVNDFTKDNTRSILKKIVTASLIIKIH